MPAHTLAFTKDFKCQSCADCCRSPRHVVLNASDHKTVSTIVTAKFGAKALPRFVTEISLSDQPQVVAILNKRAGNECVFLNDESRLCDLQTEFGHDAIPTSCKSFPRNRVRVGENNTYVFSTTCPSVRELLDTENGCAVTQLSESASARHPALIAQSDAKTLSLKSRKISVPAYHRLKAHLVGRFNEMALSEPQDVVFQVGSVLKRVHESEGAHLLDEAEMDGILAREALRPCAETVLEMQTCPPATPQHARFLSSWLALRSTAGKLDPEDLEDLIGRFSDDRNLDEMEALVKTTSAVDKLFVANQWLLRNYLAARFFHDPAGVKRDCFGASYAALFIAYALIRLILAAKARVKGFPLDRDDLMFAIEAADRNTLHAHGLDEKVALMMRSQDMAPHTLRELVRVY